MSRLNDSKIIFILFFFLVGCTAQTTKPTSDAAASPIAHHHGKNVHHIQRRTAE